MRGSRLHIIAICGALAVAGSMIGAVSASAHHYDHLLAPRSVCPHQGDQNAGVLVQEGAMRCMHRYARARVKAGSIHKSYKLQQSSERKSRDILDCQDYAHDACGRSFTYWISKVGFPMVGCYGLGENLHLRSVSKGAPRPIMSDWLHSDGHRQALLAPKFERFGIGLVKGTFNGDRVSVWTAHFAYRC
jgi:uncharacterized protein YkwD